MAGVMKQKKQEMGKLSKLQAYPQGPTFPS